MTRAEQAAFRRLEKRHRAMRSTLIVIKTWLTGSANWAMPETLCQWISELVVREIEDDDDYLRKEEQRHD